MLSTIRQKSTGDLVKVAQYLMGYAERKTATGEFDANFVAFVCSWQSKHNLTADGVIGPNTWTAMVKDSPTCSTSKNKTSAYTCAIQILVGGTTIDGVYGSNTKKVVAAYQSAKGLTADGICGPKTWAALIGVSCASANASSDTSSGSGGTSIGQTISGNKIINNCVHYLQWDSKWKNIKYSTHTSSQTIGNSGCGPTAMAQILATFIDKSITPVPICELSVANGFRTYNNGTTWGLFPYIFKHYDGFEKYVATNSIETLKAGLAEGALAVCSMNNNDNNFWTTGGHFITAIGFDDTYIYANDPNKSSAPRKQAQNKFKSCMKQAFLFWPKKQATTPVEEAKETEITTPNVDNSSNAPEEKQASEATEKYIIDISKWQGNIDFAKLSKVVSFVIARAGVGSDADPKFDEYAQEMQKYGIPFGVYCYSYAGTIAKAKDEAQKLVQRASKYNPLFYVMDAEESKITNDSIRAFATELKAHGIERIGCYVAHNHYKDYNYDSLRSLFHFTWIPRYGTNNGTIEGSTKPAYVCDLWQYTSTGKISGISGHVDMNVITGTGKSLKWFLNSDSVDIPSGIATTPAIYASVKISGGNCYVRTMSNTNGAIIGIAYDGDVLEYRGITADNGWLAVRFNGQDGWVSGKYGKVI